MDAIVAEMHACDKKIVHLVNNLSWTRIFHIQVTWILKYFIYIRYCNVTGATIDTR